VNSRRGRQQLVSDFDLAVKRDCVLDIHNLKTHQPVIGVSIPILDQDLALLLPVEFLQVNVDISIRRKRGSLRWVPKLDSRVVVNEHLGLSLEDRIEVNRRTVVGCVRSIEHDRRLGRDNHVHLRCAQRISGLCVIGRPADGYDSASLAYTLFS